MRSIIFALSALLTAPVVATPDPLEASIEELQHWLTSGELTSVELVEFYLDRIEAYDQRGPALNAVQHLSADALDQAKALDTERANGAVRSRLHGIPVLIKDNYETVDARTTAGSSIIDGHWPKRDATLVARLRAAGAIILGKTTMHEFAYGWTTRGSLFGRARNPYDPARHPGGSSGGTGAAVAANFAAVGMGSDTCGSIRVPSAHNNLVGLRGTLGLSSRHGIVPLSSSRDIGGPLARSTRDLAIVLDATVGYDPNDDLTAESFGNVPQSYRQALRPVDVGELRLGVLTAWFGDAPAHRGVNERIESVLATLTRAGATIVRLDNDSLSALWRASRTPEAYFVDDFDLKKDLTDYLEQYPALEVQSFAEVVATEALEPTVQAAWTNLLDPRFDSHETYLERLADVDAVRRQLLSVLIEIDLDALVYPTATAEAVEVGMEQSHLNCKLAPLSGFPAISVPAGFGTVGMPVGIEFLAEPWSEQKLLNLAYTVETLAPARQLPKHTP